MSQWPFRFLHAAEFHLDQPLHGMIDIPDHLREPCLEAAYRSAGRVFEIARTEAVDFVVLSGNLLNARRTGPRGPMFLVEQFRRLAEQEIPVYWCGGRTDSPDHWPAAVRLPKNVHFFSVGRPDELVHESEGQPIARVVGCSRGSQRRIRTNDFAVDPGGLFTVAVANGSAPTEALQARQIHYWALGGRMRRETLCDTPRTAHYPGSPQGRRPQDTESFGCTLVHVDDRGGARLTTMPTNSVRWHAERVSIEPTTTQGELENTLHERLRAMRSIGLECDVFVSWTVGGSGPLMRRLREGAWTADLLDALRVEHGFGSPSLWSVSIVPEATAVLPTPWYEQKTILGDFLRDVRSYQMNPERPLDLESYLSESQAAGVLHEIADLSDRSTRETVLREAALLGVDLLSGEES